MELRLRPWEAGLRMSRLRSISLGGRKDEHRIPPFLYHAGMFEHTNRRDVHLVMSVVSEEYVSCIPVRPSFLPSARWSVHLEDAESRRGRSEPTVRLCPPSHTILSIPRAIPSAQRRASEHILLLTTVQAHIKDHQSCQLAKVDQAKMDEL